MRKVCRSILLLAAVVSVGLRGAGQTPPQLPELTHKRLLNDLQVAVAATPYLGDGMTNGLVTRYGSAFDPADKGGLAHVVAQMLGHASVDRSGKDIQDELTYLGASLEIQAGWDGVRLVVRAPSARFERALLLLYQIAGEAVFSEADFAAAKAAVLKQLEEAGDPRQQSRHQFESALFRGTSFGRPLRGTKASVENITIGDVRYFYRRFFSPNAAALVIAGAVPTPVLTQKAARIWGVWVRKDEVPFTFLPPRTPASRSVVFDDDPGSPAAQFILGNLWVNRDDPTYYAAALAARILQDRLTRALPTSLVTVGFEGRRMTGPFYVQGQAAADQALVEIGKILKVAEELTTGPLAAEEVAAAQKLELESYRKQLETTARICELLLEAELYRLGTNYMVAYPDLIRRNSPDVVKEAAKNWIFPGGVLIYVRGPAGLKPALEKLGSLQPVP